MKFFRSLYHLILSWTGSIFYGNPSEDIFVLGVTGTKGKSTTLEMASVILEKSGKKTALLSSVKRKVGDDVEKNNLPNTMPGRWKLQKFLNEAVEEGCDYALVEVTSQGVLQHRHKFINWDGAMFLNLAPEHIEAHGSYEEYREAKLDFFRYLKKSKKQKKHFYINKEDSDASYFVNVAEEVDGSDTVLFSVDDVYKLAGDLKDSFGEDAPDWLRADFNLENMAGAVSFARSRAIDSENIKKALLDFRGVEGRLDFVQHEPFGVVVDYAHTPDSLRSVYQSLRDDFNYHGDLICVLGSAGGGRDKWKRPEIGEIVANYCDVAILTSEDPYTEDPEDIIRDIEDGISSVSISKSETPKVQRQVDRKKAIEKALSKAGDGDVVAITGIGSQSYFQGPEGKIDWDEKGIVEDFLNNKKD